MDPFERLHFPFSSTTSSMQDGPEILPWTAENISHKDLLLLWKEITYTLISSGHVAELHQELDHASRTGSEDPSSDSYYSAISSHDQASLPNELLPIATNRFRDDRLACGYGDKASADADTVMLSPCESENDDDDQHHDICDATYDLITESADLTHCHSPPRDFEEAFAQQEISLPYDGLDDVTPSSGRSSPAATLCLRTYSPSPSASTQEEWIDERPDEQISIRQADAEGQDSLVKGEKTITPRSTVSPQKITRLIEHGSLRLSDKKDLLPSEISVVARRLIKNDSVVYFLNNCQLIYETLVPSLAKKPRVDHHSGIEGSVIAAFDTIQVLISGKDICRLLLRFAFIHLVQVIETYKAAAAKDRVDGRLIKKVGERNITVAIDMYLEAKKQTSEEGLPRKKLLDYYRRGKRWSSLAGPFPISVFLFSRAADTIMYVLSLSLHTSPYRSSLPQKAE
jgi:hypothetical protein